MFVAPRQKPTWSECRPWRDVRVRRCGSCGLRLLQRLDPAPVVCATLLVVEVPESVVLEELLESLECRDTWVGGLERVSEIGRLGSPYYAALVDVADARTLAACGAALAAATVRVGDASAPCRVLAVDASRFEAFGDEEKFCGGAVRELPACGTCLDRLDLEDASLGVDRGGPPSAPWPGTPCGACAAVARRAGGLAVDRCGVCGDRRSVWACLVCGTLGCGRYAREHAKGHYAATRHGFALELETGRIWDYVEDRYAHRVDDDDVAASGAPCGGCGPAAPADCKFGALADHYERILEAQLAEQRSHYEERLAAADAARAAALAATAKRAGAVDDARRRLDDAKADAAALTALAAARTGELVGLRARNDALTRRAADARARAEATRAAADAVRSDTRDTIEALRAQLRDVDFARRARRQLADEAADGGTLLVAVDDTPPKRGKKKGRRRG